MVVIGVSGSKYCGKRTFISFLRDKHNFTVLHLQLQHSTNLDDTFQHFDLGDEEKLEGVFEMSFEEVSEYIISEGRWRDNYVIYPITCNEHLEILRKRPFFVHVCVDAPLSLRHQRLSLKYSSEIVFKILCDNYTTSIDNEVPFMPLRCADVILYNSSTLTHFLTLCDKTHRQLTPTRPTWDEYFMLLADLASHRSNCMKRRVGCILTKNRRILATGYNGTPRGCINCSEGGCARCNDGTACGKGLEECLCLHAEENALLEAGRERISGGLSESGNGVVLYCNTCPCLSCAKRIVQCGVMEVVYRQSYGMDEMTTSLFAQVGVILRQHHPRFNLQLNLTT